MDIIQKNVFGDNVVYYVSPDFTRNLTDELKTQIILALRTLNVSSVAIRCEHVAEAVQFATIVSQFLRESGFQVYMNTVMMSEIQRNEFSIQKHPSDPDFAIIKIGPIL